MSLASISKEWMKERIEEMSRRVFEAWKKTFMKEIFPSMKKLLELFYFYFLS